MIIERLGEATPVLDEMLNLLNAQVIGDELVVPPTGITAETAAGRATVAEMLVVLGVRTDDGHLLIPTKGIRWTRHGIEVNVREHFARLHEGEWKAPVIEWGAATG